MTIGEGIAFGGLFMAFLGLVYKFTNDEAGKRARIYGRMDEIKKSVEEKLQSKEICSIHTNNIDATLNEIRQDVKTLLKNNGH